MRWMRDWMICIFLRTKNEVELRCNIMLSSTLAPPQSLLCNNNCCWNMFVRWDTATTVVLQTAPPILSVTEFNSIANWGHQLDCDQRWPIVEESRRAVGIRAIRWGGTSTNVALRFACPVCYGIGWVGWCLLAGSPVLWMKMSDNLSGSERSPLPLCNNMSYWSYKFMIVNWQNDVLVVSLYNCYIFSHSKASMFLIPPTV